MRRHTAPLARARCTAMGIGANARKPEDTAAVARKRTHCASNLAPRDGCVSCIHVAHGSQTQRQSARSSPHGHPLCQGRCHFVNCREETLSGVLRKSRVTRTAGEVGARERRLRGSRRLGPAEKPPPPAAELGLGRLALLAVYLNSPNHPSTPALVLASSLYSIAGAP